MELVQFEDRYRHAFIDFNTDWITSNFGVLEDHDMEAFERIDQQISDGAMIFFAVQDNTPLACCMTLPLEDGTWEICKLASNKNVPHKSAGKLVFGACMSWALDHGAKRLFLISNSKLKPALHIYEDFGFREIILEDYEYERGDIAFEYIAEEPAADGALPQHTP